MQENVKPTNDEEPDNESPLNKCPVAQMAENKGSDVVCKGEKEPSFLFLAFNDIIFYIMQKQVNFQSYLMVR